MKTRRLWGNKDTWESALTISGWLIAIFVSFLYLQERGRDLAHQPVSGAEHESVSSSDTTTEQIDQLLAMAEDSLFGGRPEDAVYRITSLWSLCHTSGMAVPDRSHRIFARAVSDMAARSRLRGGKDPNPLSTPAIGELTRAPRPRLMVPDLANAADKPDSVDRTKTASFSLPDQGYPKAKGRSIAGNAGDGFPEPPDFERDQPPLPPEINDRYPGRFPPPPPEASSGPRGSTRPGYRNRDGRMGPPGGPGFPGGERRNPRFPRSRDSGIPGY